jgi:hypothetical protein
MAYGKRQERLVLALAEAYAGTTSNHFFVDKKVNSPLANFAAFADAALGKPAEVLVLSSGMPEHMLLDGPQPPCIIFDLALPQRYDYFITAISRLWALKLGAFEVVAFRMVANTLAALGQLELSIVAFARALEGRTSVWSGGNDAVGLEMLPYDEYYVAIWFSSLAHEYGHLADAAYADEIGVQYVLSEKSAYLTRDGLFAAADRHMQRSLTAADYRSWKDRLEETRSILTYERIVGECRPDICGAWLLFCFAKKFIATAAGREIDIERWSQHICLLKLMTILNYAVKSFCQVFFKSDNEYELDVADRLFQIRYSMLGNLMLRLSNHIEAKRISSSMSADASQLVEYWQRKKMELDTLIRDRLTPVTAELFDLFGCGGHIPACDAVFVGLSRQIGVHDVILRPQWRGYLQMLKRLAPGNPITERLASALKENSAEPNLSTSP